MHWFQPPCEYAGITPPIEMQKAGPIASPSWTCATAAGTQVPLKLNYAWLSEFGLTLAGPVKAWTLQDPAPNHTTTASQWPNPPSSPQEFRALTDEALNDLTLSDWYCYVLGKGCDDPEVPVVTAPHCAGTLWPECRQRYEDAGFIDVEKIDLPDPDFRVEPYGVVGNASAGHEKRADAHIAVQVNPEFDERIAATPDQERQAACNISTPTGAFGDTQGHSRWDVKEVISSLNGNVSWKLRWGSRGFGWMHIVKRHGWDDEDRASTRAALDSPPVPVREADAPGHRFWYFGPEYSGGQITGPGGALIQVLCKRLVVVRPDPYPGDADAIEIITSYGLYSREVSL